jgi:hypothetical protein
MKMLSPRYPLADEFSIFDLFGSTASCPCAVDNLAAGAQKWEACAAGEKRENGV